MYQRQPSGTVPDAMKIDRYEVQAELGRGAMGIVYKAHDSSNDRLVALKTMHASLDLDDEEDATALARFEREALAAGRLTHPGIVGVYDTGIDQGAPYIAMEYVEGKTLKQLIENDQRLHWQTVVSILSKLLEALDYAHNLGIVHRDVKPANIMVSVTGDPKIMDFGVARIENSTLTRLGDILGTPAYMAPEQIFGQIADQRADLFSTGVMLYELLVGQKPFRGNPSQVMSKVLNDEPPAPSTADPRTPVPFDGVVKRALAKRKDDRFQSARQFRAALEEAARAAAGETGMAAQPATAEDAAAQAETLPYPDTAPAVEVARLICLDTTLLRGTPDSFSILLDAPGERIVGRDKTASARIDAPVVSRQHARLTSEDGGWMIHDLESTNGIYVNGQKVTSARLHHNDVIRFGPAAFRYEVIRA